MSAAIKVLNGTKFNEEPVSTRALLTVTTLNWAEMYRGWRWSGYDTSMSSSVKVIAFVASKIDLVGCSSAARQLGPALPDFAAMAISASVAVLLASKLNPN